MTEEQKVKKRAYLKAYNEANREKILARKRAYNKENRERGLAQRRIYRKANRGKLLAGWRAYRNANREKFIASGKAYYESNSERLKKRFRLRRQKIAEEKAACEALALIQLTARLSGSLSKITPNQNNDTTNELNTCKY